MQKVGVRWAGSSDGDTQQPPPPPVSLSYTAANKEVEQQFSGGMTFRLLGIGGTCDRYSLDVSILGKAAVLRFALPPSVAGGCAIPACRSLGTAVLTLFCSWGCANSACRLCDTAMLMSGSHRLLIIHSPQGWRHVITLLPRVIPLGSRHTLRTQAAAHSAVTTGPHTQGWLW
jgi:hypothetical protein